MEQVGEPRGQDVEWTVFVDVGVSNGGGRNSMKASMIHGLLIQHDAHWKSPRNEGNDQELGGMMTSCMEGEGHEV